MKIRKTNIKYYLVIGQCKSYIFHEEAKKRNIEHLERLIKSQLLALKLKKCQKFLIERSSCGYKKLG